MNQPLIQEADDDFIQNSMRGVATPAAGTGVTDVEENDIVPAVGSVQQADDDFVSKSQKLPPPIPKVKTPEEMIAVQDAATAAATPESQEEPMGGPRSRLEMEQDEELIADIKQHMLDRYNVNTDERMPDFFFGYAFGGDELNNEEILEQWMDRWRMMTGNSMDAGFEIAWLSETKEKFAEAQAAVEANPKDLDAARAANEYSGQLARALRVYREADQMAGLFGSKRYEGLNGLQMVGEIGETVGVNVLAALSDPMTVVTAGVGKVVGLTAQSAGAGLKTAIFKAAASGAAIEAAGAAATDIAVQSMEIEMGARDSIDYERTAMVAGGAAIVSGTVSGLATRNAAKRVDKVTDGQLSEALVKNQEIQVTAAKETQKKNKVVASSIRENLAKSIEDAFGKKAVIRNKDGTVKEINSKFIRESEEAAGVYKDMQVDRDIFDPSLTTGVFERVIGASTELFSAVKNGSVRLIDEKSGKPLTAKQMSDLGSKLQAGEKVSDRLLALLKNVADVESSDLAISILGKYGITRREIAAAMYAEASKAGQKLNRLSQMTTTLGRVARNKTAQETAEEIEALGSSKLGDTFRRLEDIRRLTLVSGVATAVRNNISQVLRSGVDTLVYAFESTINPNKRGVFSAGGVQNSLAHLKNTFFYSADSARISQFLLDIAPEQRMRFYNMYSEVTNKINRGNPGQATLAGRSNGLSKETPLLDMWEGGIQTLNFFNRFQEAAYRNGAFTTSIQRQLFDKGIDMLDVLRSGKITENISEDMIAKAVDDALEFTYASQPKLGIFQTLNNAIVRTGGTLAIPFPRFMFKALEMTYNYNATGAATAAIRMLLTKSKGQKITDGQYRQLAEGVAGGMPLIALGYSLRDPENGIAGSEWYMLQDGRGNEFDARPYFPLTPYLLLGEMIHRFADDRPMPKKIQVKELVEGLTGANFRGVGPIAKMTEDLVMAFQDGGDDLKFKYTAATLGEYLGEAASGYLQPVYQLADLELMGDMIQRKKDYKVNPEYQEGVEGFFGGWDAFKEGFYRPFASRLGRIPENYTEMMENKPDLEDPRFEDPQFRVMPFMKVMFGATFTRVPPEYVIELNRMGFKYRDFTTYTEKPEFNRYMNREMGRKMNAEMPAYLAMLKRQYPDNTKLQADAVRTYITEAKSGLYKEMQLADDESGLAALVHKFNRMSPYSRQVARQQYKEAHGKSAETVDEYQELVNMAATIREVQRDLATQ